jgi:hypothetical protein
VSWSAISPSTGWCWQLPTRAERKSIARRVYERHPGCAFGHEAVERRPFGCGRAEVCRFERLCLDDLAIQGGAAEPVMVYGESHANHGAKKL